MQCALLGLKTSFVGKLGDDDFGKEYYDNLLAHNIDVSSIQKSSMATTGVACISVAENGANTIVIIPSANNLITKEDVFKESNKIKQARVLICQNEIPYHATLQALKLACEENKKIIIVLNPAPAAPYAALSELLALSDIVCPNESELTTLTGMPAETLDQVEVASKALFRMIGSGSRCNAVVVTLGERGAMIVPRSGTSVLVSITEEYRVTAIDTVGAGDCFIGNPHAVNATVGFSFFEENLTNLLLLLGTMASHLARARSLQESVHSAVRCATISVTKKGAQASYPALADLPVDLHPPPARFDTD